MAADDLRSLVVAFDSLQIVTVVPMVAKDFLPLIATENDVVKLIPSYKV